MHIYEIVNNANEVVKVETKWSEARKLFGFWVRVKCMNGTVTNGGFNCPQPPKLIPAKQTEFFQRSW